MRYILIICLILSAGINTMAQEGGWSLSDCIDYTLKNHPSVSIHQNNQIIAEEVSRQSVASYLPQLQGSANFTDNIKLQTTVLPAGAFGPEPTPVQMGTQFNTVVGVDLSQTIYDQSKIVGIKAAKPYEQMTRLQQQLNEETLVYNTAVTYLQVLIYDEQLVILESNRVKYEEMVSMLEYQLEKGVVLEKDVDRVRVNLNATNYQIEDAKTKELVAFNALKNAMGMPFSTALDIKETVDYEMFGNIQLTGDLMLDGLIEYQINQQQVALQEVNVKMQQAAYLPTISFVGKYAHQSLNNDFDNAFSEWNDFYYIGLSIKYPLFTGFGRNSKLHEEQLKLENEVNYFNINQQNLTLNFNNALTSVGSAYSTFQSSRDNLDLAAKVLNVTEYQYEKGVIGLIDYLNDDSAYQSAQSNYINSLYNLMISHLNYQKSQGTLIEYINSLK